MHGTGRRHGRRNIRANARGLLVILEQHIGMLCGGAKQIQLVLLGQARQVLAVFFGG